MKELTAPPPKEIDYRCIACPDVDSYTMPGRCGNCGSEFTPYAKLRGPELPPLEQPKRGRIRP